MAWRKSPETLVRLFDAIVPDDARAERRKMFGYPCCFTGGNMFMGLHQENLILRLPEEAREELLRIPGAARFEPMAGRVMKEYVAVPPAMLDDPTALAPWVGRSFDFALAMPPKAPKKQKSRKKA